jgi:ABC-type transport system involved in cytochrome bd biosynthesis fused ATPase/permease subunit
MQLSTAVLAVGGSLACGGPFAFWFAARAQQPTAPVPVVTADQQIAGVFSRIAQHAGRVEPMLQQVRANEWVPRGAPETYVAQLASAHRQIQAIQTDLADLTQHPDQMQDCMKVLFRVQTFHRALDSLMGGLRKYQNPALADLIQSVAAEDQADLDQLQNYILDLAGQKEQEYRVIDREAQRCRATISREPAAPAKAGRRTNP